MSATEIELDLERLEEEADAERGPSTSVQRVATIETAKLTRRDGSTTDQPLLHIAWEPLSYKQEFDRTVYPLRTDDFSHDQITIFTRDGRMMGGKTAMGQVKAAFNELGFKLTPAGMKDIEGTVFVTTRAFNEYAKKNSDGTPMVDDAGNPVMQRDWFTKPVEVLTDYQVAADRTVVRLPRNRGGSTATRTASTITADQIQALKSALNGKTEDEYFDAVVGTPVINCDPFLAELSEPSRLTERLVAMGGEVLKDRIFFS